MSDSKEIKNFIKKQNNLDTLRFITCGSVDDGKSTLLGRMLYEAQLIFDDQVDSLISDSKKIGTQGGEIDFALLVDGLSAEREQGITIDVAYRFFSTENRKFIVADSPGHEQYTRNMVTAASNAEVAIILIDARNGIMPQTKRHSFIANLLGIKKIIVAVNKMDLINFDETAYNKIVLDYKKNVLDKLNFKKIKFVPVSALEGDNILINSKNMPWYNDMPLMELLETVEITNSSKEFFSLPIQYVNRPNLNFRGFCGTVSSGTISLNDEVIVLSSNQKAKVKEIFIADVSVTQCGKGDAVTILLDREIDISRGDVLLDAGCDNSSNSGFLVNLIWFDANKGYPNRSYILKSANKQTNCEIVKIKNKIDVNSFEKIHTGLLSMNDIAECEIFTDSDISNFPYSINKTLGNLILIDKKTNLTVAAGTFVYGLRKSSNVSWQDTEINKSMRQKTIDQKSFVIWFTGLSGSGKSTIANLLEKRLSSDGYLTYLLDGDNLRHGLNKDLGFKKEDRIENIRRVGEVAKILYDSAVIVIASFISPYQKDRENLRRLFETEDFIEVHVDAQLKTLMKRDPKGLYEKASKGQIPNFTGLGSKYEKPAAPEITIDTDKLEPGEALEKILKYLKKKNAIRN